MLSLYSVSLAMSSCVRCGNLINGSSYDLTTDDRRRGADGIVGVVSQDTDRDTFLEISLSRIPAVSNPSDARTIRCH
jgi:hypothetical protein